MEEKRRVLDDIQDDNTTTKALVVSTPPLSVTDAASKMPDVCVKSRRSRFRSPWATSFVTIIVTALAILSLVIVAHSFVWRQQDAKGCRMSYMRPAFAKLDDFDTEHTRFASKYSTYLYREQMVDEDTKVGSLKGRYNHIRALISFRR